MLIVSVWLFVFDVVCLGVVVAFCRMLCSVLLFRAVFDGCAGICVACCVGVYAL